MGGFIAPLLCGWLAANRGWQAGSWIPGVIALVGGILVIPLLRDTPEELGYVVKHDGGKKPSAGNEAAEANGVEKESFLDVSMATTKGIISRRRHMGRGL